VNDNDAPLYPKPISTSFVFVVAEVKPESIGETEPAVEVD
jgi:hypothetical protein